MTGNSEYILDKPPANESEILFRGLFENSSDAIQILDNFTFVECNQATVEILHAKNKDEVMTTHPSQLSPEFQPDGRLSSEKADEMIRTALEKGGHRFEWMHRRADGENFLVEVMLTPVVVGSKTMLYSSWRDISDRKRAEAAVRDSEEKLRAVYEGTHDAVMLLDPHDPSGEWPIIDCNTAACTINGYRREELIGQPVNIVNAPTDHPIDRDDYLKQLRGTGSVKYEIFHRRKDGTMFPVETSTTLIKIGERELLLGIDRDITERKQAEADIRDNEEKLRAIYEGANDAVMLLNEKGFFDCNSQTLKMFGFKTKEEFTSIHPSDASPASQPDGRDSLSASQEHIQTAYQQGYDRFEWIHRRSNGEDFPAEVVLSAFDFAGQRVLQATVRDITERKQAEQALRDSEAKYSAVVTEARDGVAIIQGNLIQFVNQAMGNIVGYVPSEMENTPIIDYIASEYKDLLVNRMKARLAGEEVSPMYEARLQRKDGTTIDVEISANVIQYQGKPADVVMIRDITERKQAEMDLLLRDRALASSLNAVLVVGLDFKPIYVNESFLKMTGYTHEEAMQLTITDLSADPEGLKQIDETTRTQGFFIGEEPIKRKDGSVFPTDFFTSYITDAKGEPIAIQTAFTDISKRKQADAQLQQEKSISDAIINGLPGTFYLLDSQGKLIRWNKQYEQVSGHTAEELPTVDMTEMIADEDKEHVLAAMQKTFVEGQATLEVNLVDKDSKRTPYYLAAQRIQLGDQIYLAGTGTDMTERKQLENQIREALERRGLQVQLSTQVAQSIAGAPSLPELYERVVTQVKEKFDYYHTQLLRYDETQDAVVLVTGYGEVGAQMLAAGHRLPMGEGLIGTAAATGETVLRSVLENDPDWHPNPLLPETKGEIAVPIKMGDTILGVLDVQSSVAGAFDTDDQLLLEGLCGQIATAIESTRLQEEMMERLEEINHLYRAMSHEGWQTYLETADIPVGFMYDQAGLRPVQAVGLTEELFANVPLALPGGEVIGTLAVSNNDPQHFISPEEEAFLQQVSEQVALALESARLFEQTQAALGEAARRASELETVAQLSATTSTVLDPEKLLQSVVDLAKERFGLYHAHVYTFDWNTLTLAAGAGEVGRKLVAEAHAIPIALEQSLVARAARERKTIIVNDVKNEPSFLPNPLLPETCAEMAVPMVVGDKLLGIFDVQSNNATGFSDEDANIYLTLAAQIGVALQNARLYMEQADLVNELRDLDRLKSSFLANMSHELRTPLNSILGFADVIIEGLDGPLTENMTTDLQRIQRNGQHLLHLINDVLDMAKIEAGRMNLNPENFNPYEIMDEVTSLTSTFASEKNLALFIDKDTDKNVEIYADRTRLRQVMINLVNNAIKFTEKGSVAIKLIATRDEHILITVKDTGIGISADKLDAIFQEFIQVDSSSTRKAGGTGLGLPISRKLVEMHGGRLWAESTGVAGEGSTFYVELPVEAKITDTPEK